MSIAEPTDQSDGRISLSDEDRVKEVLVKAVFGLWDVVQARTVPRDDFRLGASQTWNLRL
jgi:hypothetical protein